VKKKKLPDKEKKPLKQEEQTPEKRKHSYKRSRQDDFINDQPSTSTAQKSSTAVDRERYKCSDVLLVDSQTSDSENSSPWTNLMDVTKFRKYKCPHCGITCDKRHHLIQHITTTCLLNPDSKTNKEAGKFKCIDCGRCYTHAKSLRYHQRHECKKTITCPDCGKTMQGTFITERHKQKYCVNKRRKIETIKQEVSPDELFIDESSIDYS